MAKRSSTIEEPALALALEPQRLESGHRAQILVNGAITFPVMLEAIAGARISVVLETYIFESDETGQQFIEALIERARAGVLVSVLVDAFGGLELSAEDERRMTSAGVALRFFHPFNRLDIGRWIRRDHRKLLLVDGAIGFVGGLNINNDYADARAGGKGWHDIHLRIEGPVCASLAAAFARTWKRAGGSESPLLTPPLPRYEPGDRAMALFSNHRGVRLRIRSHLLHAVKHAKSEIYIASAYFIPDTGFLRSLEKAAQRGVDVRVLVPAYSDVASAQWAGEQIYSRLLEAGVHVHPWRDSHMHAKAAVVDRRWCLVGSYNLDFVSLLYSLELVVEVVGTHAPQELAASLLADFESTPELLASRWRERSLFEDLRSRLAYRFRHWL